MLRRTRDGDWELLLLGQATRAARPEVDRLERLESIRIQVLASLTQQDHIRLAPGRERWIAIPAASLGLAAAVIGAVKVASDRAHFESSGGSGMRAAVVEASAHSPAELENSSTSRVFAHTDSWYAFEGGVTIALEQGSSIGVDSRDGATILHFERGAATIATESGTSVHGDGWMAQLAPGSVAKFESFASAARVSVLEGIVQLQLASGFTVTLVPGDTALTSDRGEGPQPGQPAAGSIGTSAVAPFAEQPLGNATVDTAPASPPVLPAAPGPASRSGAVPEVRHEAPLGPSAQPPLNTTPGTPTAELPVVLPAEPPSPAGEAGQGVSSVPEPPSGQNDPAQPSHPSEGTAGSSAVSTADGPPGLANHPHSPPALAVEHAFGGKGRPEDPGAVSAATNGAADELPSRPGSAEGSRPTHPGLPEASRAGQSKRD